MHESDWNNAIGAWFFNPAARGRPVYLSLDDETLEAIAHQSGWSTPDPVHDFEAALRVHISPNSASPFHPWRTRTEAWQRAPRPNRSEFPPFIALLGATVLAASRMGAVEKVAGLPPYYKPLREILGLQPVTGGMPPGYDTDIPALWIALRKWLDAELDGARGLATAEVPPHYWPYIGYSISQALLRGYDRAGLTDFFIAIGADPDTKLEPDELIFRLREWGSMGGRMSDRLKALLSSNDMAEFLGRVLTRELATWDGTRRDAAGRRVLRLVLTLDAKRGDLGLAAVIPSDFSPTVVEINGATCDLDPAQDFVDMPVAVTSELLNQGWTQSFPDVRLEYRARPVVPLLPDDRMNRWSSRERVEAERTHFVIAQAGWLQAIEFFFKARSPSAVKSGRVKAPPGWVAYKDVTIQSGPAEVPPALLPLVPRAEVLPSLEGGLPLVARRPIYLSGGPPDVDVPGLKGRSLSVELDGAVVAEVDARGCILSLIESAVQPGQHQVKIGSLVRRFEVLDQLREPLPSEPILAHHLTRHDIGWCADGPARQVDRSRDVAISGIRIKLMNTDFTWSDSPPVMVKASPETIALGPNHEVDRLNAEQPPWAAELDLPFNSFEITPVIRRLRFDPCWILRLFTHHYQVLHHGSVTHLEAHEGSRREEWIDLEQRLETMREDLSQLGPEEVGSWKVYRCGAM